jgi:transposase
VPVARNPCNLVALRSPAKTSAIACSVWILSPGGHRSSCVWAQPFISSTLSSDQFELIAAKLPADSRRGRPRTTSYWAILNAIFYVLCEGCTWRGLPGEFPPWQTVYTYFRRWSEDGTWQVIHDGLYVITRLAASRRESPSELIIDSQSVKTANYVHQAVGYDGAKHIKGRKRHTVVDTLGLVYGWVPLMWQEAPGREPCSSKSKRWGKRCSE